jgi:hypothetical protein
LDGTCFNDTDYDFPVGGLPLDFYACGVLLEGAASWPPYKVNRLPVDVTLDSREEKLEALTGANLEP